MEIYTYTLNKALLCLQEGQCHLFDLAWSWETANNMGSKAGSATFYWYDLEEVIKPFHSPEWELSSVAQSVMTQFLCVKKQNIFKP